MMLNLQANTLNLVGNHYEVGYQLGKLIEKDPIQKAKFIKEITDVDQALIDEARLLFDRWCPGLSEELTGFADALKVNPKYIFFYSMTYFIPCCSHIALGAPITANNKPLLARNYEFSHEYEDFYLIKTVIEGKYTHIGTSMLQFGRDDGFNEHGLAISISSCGMPVVNLPFLEKPKIKGLQYWVVVRALLENCKDVSEAITYLKEMPIAFNMNMILLDKTGKSALFQTKDGRHAIKQVDLNSAESLLYATNHSVLPKLMYLETQALVHSVERYNYIKKQIDGKKDITTTKLKEMLLGKYPNGLCFHNTLQGFGTTKSMIISPLEGTIELCWAGKKENGWRKYDITQIIDNEHFNIEIDNEEFNEHLFDWQDV